jgi:hypothetical protein
MTIAQQRHNNKTHQPGYDPACPICSAPLRFSKRLGVCALFAALPVLAEDHPKQIWEQDPKLTGWFVECQGMGQLE